MIIFVSKDKDSHFKGLMPKKAQGAIFYGDQENLLCCKGFIMLAHTSPAPAWFMWIEMCK
jgi:hypothetical protein